MSNTIYWLGAVLNNEGMVRYKGEAPSASIWSRGLLNGILEQNCEVKVYAPIWDSYFPKGYLIPGKNRFLDKNFQAQKIGYINLPWLRKALVSFNLKRHIIKNIRNNGLPDVILNYNPYPHYLDALKSLKKSYPNLLWINIVLDYPDPRLDNWKTFVESTKGSDGFVFLSWWGFQNAPVQNKIHMDCGWEGDLPTTFIPILRKKVFIYAGKMADYGGVSDLIQAINLIEDSDLEFHFYGKGTNANLEKLALTDSRVRIKGFVSDEILHEACQQAFGFLSPRDMSYRDNQMIFPSKILFYLKYRKPVVSAKLPGIAPEYDRVLIYPDESIPISWANAIRSTKMMSKMALDQLNKGIEELLESRRWRFQAKRLVDFIESQKRNEV